MTTAERAELPLLLAGRARQTRAPALAAALVGVDGLIDAAVVGATVRGGGDPAAPDDLWHIGSCGKSMTGALYARLVEAGEAEWGAPLTALLPDLSGIDRGWSAVTIDQVLACVAGLPANLTRAELAAGWRDERPLTEQRTEIAGATMSAPPAAPGRFVYSNLGYIVAGAVIERLTGRPFEEALVTHVLRPLGITTAGFGAPPRLVGHAPRVLLGSLAVGRGRPVPASEPQADNPAIMGPAGRVHLSVADWAAFHTMVLRRGGDFLTPESLRRLMTTPAGSRMGMGWADARGVPATHGMQGSNTMWAATALVDIERSRTAFVLANDGRTRMLNDTARLAARMLAR